MADWFESNSAGGSGGETGGKPESGVPRHRPSPAGQESGGWSSPAPDAQTGSTASSGGDGADAPYSPWPSAGTPSSAQSPSGGWQAAPQRPAPSYNPYGWQPPGLHPRPYAWKFLKTAKKEKERPWHPHRCTGRAVRGDHHRAVCPARPSLGRRNQSFGRWRQQHGRREPASSFHNGDAPKTRSTNSMRIRREKAPGKSSK